MELENIFLGAGITIVALNLLLISLLTYWRFRKFKLILLSVVFLLFFIRGMLYSLSLFYTHFEIISSLVYIWVFDLIILGILYYTSLKR